MSEEPKKELKRLSAVETPPEPERFSTMISGLDACLAEHEDGLQGLPLGTSILLSGMPGGGKSTIATYMGASQHGRESAIFHGEERAERVKQRWMRLGLSDADPFVIPLKHGEEALEVIRDINAEPGGKGLGMVIIDSIQTVLWGGKRKYDAQLEAAEMIVGQVTAAGGCVVLVSHVDKSGAAHQGAAALAHLVDIHLHLTANAKKSERTLEVRKNRVGRAGFQVPLNVLQNGLSVGVPAPLTPGSGLGQARTALEKARDIAYAMLLEGKHVDGYAVFELPPSSGVTNGGMWRAGLEMAAKALVRDGFSVVQEKLNGRKGYRVENPPPKAADGSIVVVTKHLAVDDGNNLVAAAPVPSPPSGPVVKANGDVKPDKPKFTDAVEPGVLPIELD